MQGNDLATQQSQLKQITQDRTYPNGYLKSLDFYVLAGLETFIAGRWLGVRESELKAALEAVTDTKASRQ
jgi:hypothetical protein